MTNKIKILPENLANKIAAGEVVQRPESVVKELIENSIDAHAANIEVIIKKAGKTLIQVIDDGDGMAAEDAVLSIQRHATSKIYTYEDLEEIHTYGFRGEALSSIASVSQFELRTRQKAEELGTSIKLEESQIIQEKGSYPSGTSITVKNLFYNTPARRNFLKSDVTELKHILETFKKLSLSQPSVAFRLFVDDDMIFNYAPGSIEERIMSVFADNMLDALIEVKELTEYLSLTGYIAKPAFLKKSRGEQYLFINNRYVISKQINHAVFAAYEHILEKGDYPFFILFLTLDPKKVDINVHPSKLEVKFEDDRDAYHFVLAVIKKSLGSYDLVPSMSFQDTNAPESKLSFDAFRKTQKRDFEDRPFTETSGQQRPVYDKPQRMSDDAIDLLFSSLSAGKSSSVPDKPVDHPFKEIEGRESSIKETKFNESESTFIIQLHNKYILSQIRSGLMIIDQHVAHERILYEKALRAMEANLPFSQQLLFSQTLNVDPADFLLLKELHPFLTKLGFEIKFFSKNTVVIDGVPQDVKMGTEEKILIEILDEYKKNQREKSLETRDNLAKSFSCKAAIKAGDRLNEKEMHLLVDQLFATSMPYACPHGRPVVIKIPLDEFDKRFGRTS